MLYYCICAMLCAVSRSRIGSSALARMFSAFCAGFAAIVGLGMFVYTHCQYGNDDAVIWLSMMATTTDNIMMMVSMEVAV